LQEVLHRIHTLLARAKVFRRFVQDCTQRFGSGSGFNQISGSGVRIQEGKIDPQKVKKFHVLMRWKFSFEDWRLFL
jgi:hypothetical protein